MIILLSLPPSYKHSFFKNFKNFLILICLIILIWNDDYEAQNIYELTWDQFLKYRRWKKPENKWYVPIPIKIRGEFIKIL